MTSARASINALAIAAAYNRAVKPVVDAIKRQFALRNGFGSNRCATMIGHAIKSWTVTGMLCCALLAAPLFARADAQPTPGESHEREYLIKAAFLYNFAKFTAWPDHAFASDSPNLTVCVLGDDPFGDALDSIEGKSIQGRVLKTARIDHVEQAAQCQLLFIAASEEERLSNVLEQIGSLPVLTVAELPRFVQTGGNIKLKNVDNKVRLEINVEVAARAGLHLSSQLLRLAEAVTSQETRKSVDAQIR